jgi:serine/threonine protein kinase
MAKTSSKPTKPKLLLKKGKYQVFEELGRGSFGIVSRGKCDFVKPIAIRSEINLIVKKKNIAYDTINKRDCAIKQEKNCGKGTASNEDQIYAKIGELPGFLQKYDYFTEGPTRYVVFNLLDDDLLKRTRQQPGKKLDLKSVIMIAIQMVSNCALFYIVIYVLIGSLSIVQAYQRISRQG